MGAEGLGLSRLEMYVKCFGALHDRPKVLRRFRANVCTPKTVQETRRGPESMGNKVPWKTGMLIHLPATSRPLIFLQQEARGFISL